MPSIGASGIDTLHGLWTTAGLDAIETREISVRRTFTDFDDFWTVALLNPRVGPTVAAMPAAELKRLRARMLEHLPPDDAMGVITYTATANAIKGRRPV
jgi:hypothetical protein